MSVLVLALGPHGAPSRDAGRAVQADGAFLVAFLTGKDRKGNAGKAHFTQLSPKRRRAIGDTAARGHSVKKLPCSWGHHHAHSTLLHQVGPYPQLFGSSHRFVVRAPARDALRVEAR